MICKPHALHFFLIPKNSEAGTHILASTEGHTHLLCTGNTTVYVFFHLWNQPWGSDYLVSEGPFQPKPLCDRPYSDKHQHIHLSPQSKKYCEPNTVLATCFRQFSGTSVAWWAIPSCQDSYPTKTGCLCYGWLQISIWAVWVCAAPWPLVVCPLQFVLCTALSTARCLPNAVSVAPTDIIKQRFIHK